MLSSVHKNFVSDFFEDWKGWLATKVPIFSVDCVKWVADTSSSTICAIFIHFSLFSFPFVVYFFLTFTSLFCSYFLKTATFVFCLFEVFNLSMEEKEEVRYFSFFFHGSNFFCYPLKRKIRSKSFLSFCFVHPRPKKIDKFIVCFVQVHNKVSFARKVDFF
jgi:hypothetical protein